MPHSRRWPLLALLLLGCRRAPVPVPLRPEIALPLVPVMRSGRGAVVGVVADSALGYPVAGAAVYVTGDTVVGLGEPEPLPGFPADSTDPRGGFALGDMPPGTHTLAVRKAGYVTERQVVVIQGGVADTVVVRLQERMGVPP